MRSLAWLPDVHDGLGNFPCELHLRRGEAFRRILEHYLRVREPVEPLLDPSLRRARATSMISVFLPKTYAALRGRGGIVQVDDGRFAPTSDSTVRSIKSSRACTSTWSQTSSGVRFSSMSRRIEREFGVRGGREADLDFLEAALHRSVWNNSSFCATFMGTGSA